MTTTNLNSNIVEESMQYSFDFKKMLESIKTTSLPGVQLGGGGGGGSGGSYVIGGGGGGRVSAHEVGSFILGDNLSYKSFVGDDVESKSIKATLLDQAFAYAYKDLLASPREFELDELRSKNSQLTDHNAKLKTDLMDQTAKNVELEKKLQAALVALRNLEESHDRLEAALKRARR